MSEQVPAGGPYKAAIGLHEPLLVEHLKDARRMLSYYCLSKREYCDGYVRRVLEASRSVAEARLEDIAGSKDYRGVDADIMKSLPDLVSFYSEYLAGLYVLHGEDVMVRSKADLDREGLSLRRGEITLLPPGTALRLALSRLVEPVRSNAINLRSPEGLEG